MLKLIFGCVKQSLQLGPISQSVVQNQTFFLRKLDFGHVNFVMKDFANGSLFFQKILKFI